MSTVYGKSLVRMSEDELLEMVRAAQAVAGIHRTIANDVPQIARGMVWCLKCGHSQKVDGAECLRSGWPKCCGHTMTIDSPEERARLAHGKNERYER